MSGPSLSTHVLDTERGKPAAGVRVQLHRLGETASVLIASAETDGEGRIADLAPELEPSLYEIHFDTAGYLRRNGHDAPFLHAVVVQFRVGGTTGTDRHYHIPLLLAPFGATTYRGS